MVVIASVVVLIFVVVLDLVVVVISINVGVQEPNLKFGQNWVSYS